MSGKYRMLWGTAFPQALTWKVAVNMQTDVVEQQ